MTFFGSGENPIHNGQPEQVRGQAPDPQAMARQELRAARGAGGLRAVLRRLLGRGTPPPDDKG